MASAVAPESAVHPNFERISGISFPDVALPSGTTGKEIPVQLALYDDARLEKSAQYLTSGTVDPAALSVAEANSVVIIQTVRPQHRDKNKKEIVPITRFKVGDTLDLYFNASSDGSGEVRQVKVAGILSQSAFASAYMGNLLTVIGTKPVMTEPLEAVPAEERANGTAIAGVQIALHDGADAEPVREELDRIAASIPGAGPYNMIEQQRHSRQFAVQMQIFVYSFLAIIGLIGSLNIVNTVQTNLLLRRREIALLQAVGMTMRQIRKMATAEGVWFGVIGSFWGLLLGGAISYFLFVQLIVLEGMPFEFPWSGSLVACLIALCVGLLSVQGPLRRMAKANLIDELREDA